MLGQGSNGTIRTCHRTSESSTRPKLNYPILFLPEQQKQEIIELIREYKHAQELIAQGVEPRSRVLLKGAPSNGKTMLAEVIAAELGSLFLVGHYEDVVSSFLSEASGRLEKVFSEATEAPCALFFDEFDVRC